MRSYTFLLAAVAAFCASPAFATDATPVGTWTTFTDDHKPKSHVEISDNNGVLSGKVAEIMISDKGPNPVCEECEGEEHNKPLLGMTILKGFKKTGDDLWE